MEYIIINHNELSALNGLPYLQQLTYLRGLKPYVDYQTSLIGIRRGVSYQSLIEALYIEPHQGIQSGSPSKDQIRRSLKALEKAGLIEIQSLDNKLIFKCLLLDRDNSVRNKVAMKSPAQPATKSTEESRIKSVGYISPPKKTATPKSPQPAIPQNNNNFIFFLLNAFEEFWESYPLKSGKDNALEAFKKLTPSEALFAEIKAGLQQQIEFYNRQKATGAWMPAWKYPANWLTQQCWKDSPMTTESQQENCNATDRHHFAIQATGNGSEQGATNVYNEAEFQKFWKMY